MILNPQDQELPDVKDLSQILIADQVDQEIKSQKTHLNHSLDIYGELSGHLVESLIEPPPEGCKRARRCNLWWLSYTHQLSQSHLNTLRLALYAENTVTFLKDEEWAPHSQINMTDLGKFLLAYVTILYMTHSLFSAYITLWMTDLPSVDSPQQDGWRRWRLSFRCICSPTTEVSTGLGHHKPPGLLPLDESRAPSPLKVYFIYARKRNRTR